MTEYNRLNPWLARGADLDALGAKYSLRRTLYAPECYEDDQHLRDRVIQVMRASVAEIMDRFNDGRAVDSRDVPALVAEILALRMPINMVLFCPRCGAQHIDTAEEEDVLESEGLSPGVWHNPPHRSHLCHACGLIWRPADVPTNGVGRILTAGQKDAPAPYVGQDGRGEQLGALRDLIGRCHGFIVALGEAFILEVDDRFSAKFNELTAETEKEKM